MRTPESRTCSTCNSTFRPNSRHRECGVCRDQKARVRYPCACGRPKRPVAKVCRDCTYGPVGNLPTLAEADAAWLAGILEGEGTFVVRKSGGGVIRVQMTDYDVTDRILTFVPFAARYEYRPKSPRHKPSWIVRVQRRAYVSWLVQQVAPHLGQRRRAAVARLLANFVDAPPMPAARPWNLTIADPVGAAWAAGLIEGEGSILRAGVSVASIDRDVIDRLATTAGTGRVYRRSPQQPHHNEIFVWNVGARAEVTTVLDAIRPWMLSRRSHSISMYLG